jgi:type II secretory pathway predicted ATPase ExeA
MYKAFFGMVNTPFSRKVPPEALYSSQAMDECLGRMKYVSSEQLLAVVTSDPGCGKSTMIRRLVHELPSEQYISLYLSDSKLTPKWLYNGLIQQLGGTQKFYRGDAKIELQREIELIRGMQNKKVVCILDEAHLLDKETLEELRFFMNTKIDSESPLALILVGQTELRTDKLNLQRYAAIRQRIDINCVLPKLDRAEIDQYIQAHLNYAGCVQEIFTSPAVDEIYKTSTGIPRIINRICEKALMYSFQQKHRFVDDHTITYVTEH